MSEQTTILADGTEHVAIEITGVRYDRLQNLGNYQNQKIGVSAAVREGQDPAAVLAACKTFVGEQLGDVERQAREEDRRWRREQQARETENKIEKLTATYQEVCAGLAALGITPETRPDLRWYLPSGEGAAAEQAQPVEDDDDDYPDDDEGRERY